MKKLLYFFMFIGCIGSSYSQNTEITNFNFGSAGQYQFAFLMDAVLETPTQVLLAYNNRSLVSVNLNNPVLFDTINFMNSPVGTNNIRSMCKQGNEVWIAFNNGWISKKLSIGFQHVNLNLLYSGIQINKITDFNGNLAIASNQGLFIYDGVTLTRYYSGNSSILNDTITTSNSLGSTMIFTTKAGQLYKLTNNQISGFNILSTRIRNAVLGFNGEIYAVSPTIDSIIKIEANGSINYILVSIWSFRPSWVSILERNLQDSSIILCYPIAGVSLCRIKQNDIYIGRNELGGSFSRLLTEANQLFFISASKFPNSAGFFLDFEKFRSVAQSNENIKKLDINNVSATYNQQGDFFMYGDQQFYAGYKVPKSEMTPAIFAKSLWIGGKDQNNNLHISAQTYREASTLGFNFISGLLNSGAALDTLTAPKFNRIWEVTKYQIQDFQIAFANGNIANGSFQIPKDILEWPGNRPNSTEKLAPFVDVNNDNIYNPMDGDYPLIKGDKMLWWVYNDARPNRNLGDTTSLGVEIRVSAYAYACSILSGADTVLNYTTFLNFDIQNRSNNTYTDTYIGNFADVDLGNSVDDIVGCFVDKSTWFTLDATFGNPGNRMSALGFTLLNGPSADLNDGIDNDRNGITDEPNERIAMSGHVYFANDASVMGNPVNGSDAYHYLKSEWRDGTPITYGGTGYRHPVNPTFCTSTIPAKFMLPGSSDSIGYGVGGTPSNPILLPPWGIGDTCGGSGAPGDRRNLASFGPFTFVPNQTQNLEMAIIYSRGSGGAYGSVNQLYNHDIDRIKFWYANQLFPSCGYPLRTQELKPKPEINFFPNPTNTGLLNYQMKEAGRHTYQIFNITGKRISTGILFESQGTLDLSNLANGMYFIQIVDGKTYKIVVNR